MFKKLPQGARRLSPVQIRLTKAAILIADVASMLFAGLIAAVCAQSVGGANSAGWLVSQDEQRYWAWLAIVLLSMLLFLVRFRHYTDRKPYWTELGEVLRYAALLCTRMGYSLEEVAQLNRAKQLAKQARGA